MPGWIWHCRQFGRNLTLQVLGQESHSWNSFWDREARANNKQQTFLKMVLKFPFHFGQVESHLLFLSSRQQRAVTVNCTLIHRERATVNAVLTVGFSHARYPSGNRASSIGMGTPLPSPFPKQNCCNSTPAHLPATSPAPSARDTTIP